MRSSLPISLLACLALCGLASAVCAADCRSRETAETMAYAPGFFVHGLGRYYAGNTAAATSLAGGELLALGLGYYSGGIDRFGRDNAPMAVLAAGIFIATWVIDVVKAPGDADRWNRAHGCGGPSPIEVGTAAPPAREAR